MLSYKDYLNEALITFGKKAFPKFGNIVILQGGAGSGKGFIKDNLLGIEGWNYDVDRLKTLAMHSKLFAHKVKKEMGVDIKNLDLTKPENVSLLHGIVSSYDLDNRFKSKEFETIVTADPRRKPNLIFDVTGKDLKKFADIHEIAINAGYDVKNIHVVWVLDTIDAAIEKNKDVKRGRVVPMDILIQTHEGVALTAKKLLSMGNKIKQYMDGDYWIAFNKIKVDSDVEIKKSDQEGFKHLTPKKRDAIWIKEANYVKIKERGKAPISPDNFDKNMSNKIMGYIPHIDIWK